MAVAACALGMGAKESMVTAPVMVVLFDRVFLFDSFRAAVAVAGGLCRPRCSRGWCSRFSSSGRPRAGLRRFLQPASACGPTCLNQSVMICGILRLAVWPSGSRHQLRTAGSLRAAGCPSRTAIVVSLLSLTVAAFRRWNVAAFLGAWLFITLAPSSSSFRLPPRLAPSGECICR